MPHFHMRAINISSRSGALIENCIPPRPRSERQRSDSIQRLSLPGNSGQLLAIRESMRSLLSGYWTALVLGLTTLLLSSSTTTAVPVTHSSIRQDISEPVTGRYDRIDTRMLHLTARIHWDSQLGAWSVRFFSFTILPLFQQELVGLYNEVMSSTATGQNGRHPMRYIRFVYGRMHLIFQSVNAQNIPWAVVYAFAAQAMERLNRVFIGFYSGVSDFFPGFRLNSTSAQGYKFIRAFEAAV